FIRTNLNAVNYRLVTTSIRNPGKENWRDFIPHRDSVLLDGFRLFKNHLVTQESMQGLNKLRVIRMADKAEHFISFDDPVYLANLGYNPQFDSDVLRYTYQSPRTPASVIDYNLNTKEAKLMKQVEV